MKNKNIQKFHPIREWMNGFFTGYRRQFWYIAGLVLTVLSIVVMLVSMFFMYFGSFAAVGWFIGACPVIVFGILTATETKRRYEEAIAEDKAPIPMFWHIRYAVLLVREFISKNGLWRFIFITLTAVSLIVTLAFAGISGHYYLERDDIKRNIDFIAHNSEYDKYRELWEQSYLNGDEATASEYYTVMDEHHTANAKARADIKEYTEKLDKNLLRLSISALITAFMSVVLVAYIIRRKMLNKATD